MNQDFVTWVGQGRIADRAQEHLGASDRGIVMVRRRFLNDIEAVAAGKDPKAVVRDPAVNARIDLPVAERRSLLDGMSRADMLRDPFSAPLLAGLCLPDRSAAGSPRRVPRGDGHQCRRDRGRGGRVRRARAGRPFGVT